MTEVRNIPAFRPHHVVNDPRQSHGDCHCRTLEGLFNDMLLFHPRINSLSTCSNYLHCISLENFTCILEVFNCGLSTFLHEYE